MPRRTPNTGADAPKTIDDLRRVTGLGKDLVKAGIRAGELPGYVVGTRFVIPAAAFESFCRNEWTPKPRSIFAERVHPKPQLIHSLKSQTS